MQETLQKLFNNWKQFGMTENELLSHPPTRSILSSNGRVGAEIPLHLSLLERSRIEVKGYMLHRCDDIYEWLKV